MVNNIIKKCKTCKQEKELDKFYNQKKKKSDGTEYIYYHPNCKECVLQNMRNNYEENYRKLKEQRRRNPTATRMVAKRYRKNHSEAFYAYTKKWQKKHPEKVKEYNARHKDKKFKISWEQWENCKKYFNHACAYCGISVKEAKEKYNKTLNKEHAFNNGANDISNCVPACTGCNSLKNKQDYIDWYNSDNPLYNEERFRIIEQWLNEDHKKFI